MGMTVNDLLTVGQMQNMLGPLLQEIKTLRSIAAKASDRYFTIDEAATYTGHCTKVVRNWIKEGKPDRGGKIVKLKASEFAPGKYRISKQDLDAYGRIGLD
ncbi:helix-turn-helix domain-containing protein [Pontibacter mangrovi]|uniref:Helix-turn-helix domain-containing protein n=1 Tax=Pontibacter mangrovi TaxID=2589816 RepID=A0A501W5M3_9BACT|nr:helix-turn-helix domain-containing protein [Pontibacter mangrovi]TPE43945.1 helix-turn-helix domain-containing protein [Pontibacter mangrovi]